MTYSQVLKKLSDRFGEHELPETAQAAFNQAAQNTGESLDQWEDRVLTLSGKAFKELPEKYVASQVVSRFCLGLADKEAGQQVSMQSPSTLQQAKHLVKKCQQVNAAFFGKRTKRRGEETERVSAVAAQPQSATPSDLSELMKAMQLLDEKVTTGRRVGEVERVSAVPQSAKQPDLSVLMNAIHELERKMTASLSNRRQRPPRPAGCFNCGENGHFRRVSATCR